ncbi:MAG: nucleoside deaminase [Acidimicrobiia bacterium]|nr:nucleoside deaminase [Acidimicrobiia bacterium]
MSSFTIDMPDWFDAMEAEVPPRHGDEARMATVIEFARRNVVEGTGGPFAAGVFECESGRLVAAGVNVVVPSRTAIAHAEVTAVALAGQRIGGFDLGDPDGPAMELVASTAPCVMCLGVTIWSGVSRLVCGARAVDATAIGFDEGPRPDDWLEELAHRGIGVERDVLREEAAGVLRAYAERGGPIYNGGVPGA